jgi:hypothetical protein
MRPTIATAMSAANWIALASVGAVAIVALVGMIVNARTQRREGDHREREADAQRKHALAMARAARFFEARLHAYGEAARMLERIRLDVQRIVPMFVVGEPIPPPGGFDDAEWESMVATISVASSPQVLAAIDEAHAKFTSFRAAAGTYVSLRRTAIASLGDSGKEMEESRAAAYDAIDVAEQMMRDELHAL